jgi:PEP-CTERM motif
LQTARNLLGHPTQTGTFNGPLLNAGNYWLTLQNAVTNTGDPVYWDENSGPSQASENFVGTIPSESFTILGAASSGAGSTPEPSTLVLFGSGIVGLAGLLRRPS